MILVSKAAPPGNPLHVTALRFGVLGAIFEVIRPLEGCKMYECGQNFVAFLIKSPPVAIIPAVKSEIDALLDTYGIRGKVGLCFEDVHLPLPATAIGSARGL